jgi:hypothetical protein
MSDEGKQIPAALGSNAREVLKGRVDRRVTILDEIDALKVTLTEFKAEDKADGFTEKMVAQLIKEKRRGADFSVAQLTLELEVKTGREAVGLPATVEEAMKLASATAAEVPEAKSEKRAREKRRGMN